MSPWGDFILQATVVLGIATYLITFGVFTVDLFRSKASPGVTVGALLLGIPFASGWITGLVVIGPILLGVWLRSH